VIYFMVGSHTSGKSGKVHKFMTGVCGAEFRRRLGSLRYSGQSRKRDVNTARHDHTEAMSGSIEQVLPLIEHSSKAGAIVTRFSTTISSFVCNCENRQCERPKPTEE
jgi:hypothetical protein